MALGVSLSIGVIYKCVVNKEQVEMTHCFVGTVGKSRAVRVCIVVLTRPPKNSTEKYPRSRDCARIATSKSICKRPLAGYLTARVAFGQREKEAVGVIIMAMSIYDSEAGAAVGYLFASVCK